MNTPFAESVDLDNGGILTLTRFPGGEGRLALEVAGVRCSWPVTAGDVHRLSDAAIAVSLMDEFAGFRS